MPLTTPFVRSESFRSYQPIEQSSIPTEESMHVDLGELNGAVTGVLADVVLTPYERDPNAFKAGRKIDQIVNHGEADLRAKTDDHEPPLRAEVSEADKAKRRKLIAKASDGTKIYRPYTSEFPELIEEFAQLDLADVSHSKAKELLKAAGVDHMASAHWGSALDALLSQLPRAGTKVLLGFALGSDVRGLVADVIDMPLLSLEAEKSAGRVAASSIKAGGRMVAGGALKSFRNLECFGRSVPPSAKDRSVQPADLQRIEDALRNLPAASNSAAPAASVGSAGSIQPDSTLAEDNLEQLRDQLMHELIAMQAEDEEFFVALGVDAAQRQAIALAVANAAVQMVVKVGGGIALTAAGVGALAPLLAVVSYPTMSAVTKGVSNYQETKKISRVGIHKYKVSRRTGAKEKAEQLEEVSHFLQDHFQHSKEANHHRKLDNVLYVRLGEAAEKIEANDYRLEELRRLTQARTEPELKLTQKALKIQREINAINHGFKAVKHGGLLRGTSLEYLKEDSAVVESLIAQAHNRSAMSNTKFMKSFKANAAALLTVQASPYAKSVDLFTRFGQAYEDRMGKPLSNELLIERYQDARRSMKAWLARNIDPRHGPASTPAAPVRIGSGAMARADAADSPRERSAKRYDYLKSNLKLIEARQKKLDELQLAQSDLEKLQLQTVNEKTPRFDKQMEKIAQELATLQKTNADEIAAYRRYKQDVEHFENGRGEAIDLDGQVARHVLAHDKDIPHQLARFFSHDLVKTVKRKAKGELSLGVGTTIGLEAPANLIRLGQASTPTRPTAALRAQKLTDYSIVPADNFSSPELQVKTTVLQTSEPVESADVSSTDGVSVEATPTDPNAQLWSAIDTSDLAGRCAAYESLFAGRSRSDSMEIFEKLVALADASEPALRGEKLAWVAFSLKYLHEDDRLANAQRVLRLAQSLPAHDRDQTLFQLGIQFQHFKLSDRNAYFDGSFMNQLLDEVNKLPADVRGGHLVGLIHRLKYMGRFTRVLAFKAIADSMPFVDPEDRAIVLEQLIQRTALLNESARADFLKRALAATSHLTQDEALDIRSLVFTQIGHMPVNLKVSIFKELLTSTLVEKPFDTSHSLSGGPNGKPLPEFRWNDFLNGRPGQVRQGQVGNAGLQFKLPVWLSTLLGSGEYPGPAHFKNIVPVSRTDNSIELIDLIAEVPSLAPENRLEVFNSILDAVRSIHFDAHKLAPLAVLAAQIGHLPQSEQQEAFDGLMREIEDITLLERVGLLAECIEALPENFRLAAFDRVLAAVNDLPEVDRPEALHAISDLVKELPQKDLPAAFEQFFKSFWIFTDTEMASHPLNLALRTLEAAMRRVAVTDRAKVEDMHHRADIECHVRGDAEMTSEGTLESLNKSKDWRDEKANPLPRVQIPYDDSPSSSAKLASSSAESEQSLVRDTRGAGSAAASATKRMAPSLLNATGSIKRAGKISIKAIREVDPQDLFDPLSKVDASQVRAWIRSTSRAGKHGKRFNGLRVEKSEWKDRKFRTGAVKRINVGRSGDSTSDSVLGDLPEATRLAISKELVVQKRGHIEKQVVYELVEIDSSADGADTPAKSVGGTWHSAKNLKEVQDKASSMHRDQIARYGEDPPVRRQKIRRVFEIQQKSSIPLQFEILNEFEIS